MKTCAVGSPFPTNLFKHITKHHETENMELQEKRREEEGCKRLSVHTLDTETELAGRVFSERLKQVDTL